MHGTVRTRVRGRIHCTNEPPIKIFRADNWLTFNLPSKDSTPGADRYNFTLPGPGFPARWQGNGLVYYIRDIYIGKGTMHASQERNCACFEPKLTMDLSCSKKTPWNSDKSTSGSGIFAGSGFFVGSGFFGAASLRLETSAAPPAYNLISCKSIFQCARVACGNNALSASKSAISCECECRKRSIYAVGRSYCVQLYDP